MKESDMKKDNMAKMMAIGFISSFIMAYVLAYVLMAFDATTAAMGAEGGFWLWLGFIATLTSGDVTWGGKSWTLWLINNVNWIVALVLMGAIIAHWG